VPVQPCAMPSGAIACATTRSAVPILWRRLVAATQQGVTTTSCRACRYVSRSRPYGHSVLCPLLRAHRLLWTNDTAPATSPTCPHTRTGYNLACLFPPAFDKMILDHSSG
jgi:hypothetical protein